MAEQQNNVEVPKETVEAPAPVDTTTAAPAAETAAPAEAKPAEETAAPAAETAPAAEDKPAEAVAEEPKAEETKEEKKEEEVTPIEEGQLSHKAQGLSFPKNLIPSKEFFFFGNEAVEPKTLESYQRSEKSTETAQSNVAWASQTGKGLLFIGDKKAPTGIINLSDATEPEVDGSNKFTLTSKGNKHTFKAANTAERDNWVSQLKLKIAEAKELATSVPESETYKQTLESFKPAKKEEKPAATAPGTTEEPAKTEDAPAAAEETPKAEGAAAEEAPKEAVKEEPKVEEPKRRSASRKRTSFFGFGKKEGAKSPKEESNKQLEETPAAEPATTEAAPAAEEPAKEEAAAPAAPAAEENTKENATEEAKTSEEKPAVTKRNSIFGSVFGKKEKKTAEPKGEAKAVEVSEEAAAPKADDALPVVAGDAPVIPPVEATTPLEASTASPATAPVETTDASATSPTVGEPKKDVKEKRKSSLPFAFGKRDKSPSPVEGEKTKSSSPFSKFRETIKGKSKPAEKPAEEKPAEEKTTEETAAPAEEAKAEETPAQDAAPATEETKPAETEAEPKVENATPAPVAVNAAA